MNQFQTERKGVRIRYVADPRNQPLSQILPLSPYFPTLPEFVYRLPQLKELNLKKSGISKETAKEIKGKLPRTKVKS